MHETELSKDRFIIVGIENENSGMTLEESLDELEELIQTSGAEVAGRIAQKRERAHPAHYLGKGKVDELKDTISLFNATGIVCDDELSSTQIRNLSEMLDVKILDRTLIILDIFAGRASSLEGKVQVELAQQKYRLSHLTGMGKNLSRLGGGIGTRGPGEKKLETDRRHIKDRIVELEAKLKEIETHRQVLRGRRERKSEVVFSLVGYTNAGKSTLLNTLTGAGIFASDQLFATLDTTSRALSLGNASKVLLTDTVGFINKLPHSLIKAFRSTLDELRYADIIIHVVDASSPSRALHMEVVYDTLKDLKCTGKPVITVYNKIDKCTEYPLPPDENAKYHIKMCAVTGDGAEALTKAAEDILKSMRNKISAVVPYEEGSLLNMARTKSEIIKEEYRESGIYIEAYVTEEIYNKISKYITD